MPQLPGLTTINDKYSKQVKNEIFNIIYIFVYTYPKHVNMETSINDDYAS